MLKSLISNFLFFIISVIVLFFYQINVNNLTTEYVINSLIGNFILLIFILLISILSQYYYENDLSYKRRSKNIFSFSIFKSISQYIHISTIVIAVNALLIDNFLELDFHNNLSLRYLGVSFSSIAIALFISSKISLGNNYSPCYDHRTPKFINKEGIYKYVRHPMYSSNILLLIGTLIISGSYLMFINIVLLTFFYILSAFKEEKYLINKFPNYRSYSKKTGMFIPRYWK
tara:strand:+ start:1230 stop:1919 length:690 start_codon:yes stop_codon:yes gene_type:complete